MTNSLASRRTSIYAPSEIRGPLRQGEILTGVRQYRINPDSYGAPEPRTVQVSHPIALIVSQDCDLDWDYQARQENARPHKLIPNVLFCMVVTAERLRGLGPDAGINSKTWGLIQSNKNERYHFFQLVPPEQDLAGEGLPELGTDFKQYFSIPTEEVYFQLQSEQARRRCRLLSPYLEHFSTRFCYYQLRVALPEDHFSEPG
jgi:hypothetical protein